MSKIENKMKKILDEIEIDGTQIQKMAKVLPQYTAEALIMAKTLKTAYDALIKAGFKPDQALEIVKYRGIMLV